MSPNEYQIKAMEKEADQEKIRQRIYAAGVIATRLENGLRGLTNEVGELADAVKGWLEYGRDLNRVNILEEVGDVLWRSCQILKAVGFTLEDAMEANLRKLGVRFEGRAGDHTEADRDREAELAAMIRICPACEGSGWKGLFKECKNCNGTGKV